MRHWRIRVVDVFHAVTVQQPLLGAERCGEEASVAASPLVWDGYTGAAAQSINSGVPAYWLKG
ncbi:MAG: hypothetical protein JO057_26725 [Chloroflexi bacterium]|nr:hypothetical protein [Chloroflexota bacterium]